MSIPTDGQEPGPADHATGIWIRFSAETFQLKRQCQASAGSLVAGLETPDALQVATAPQTECTMLVTNDREIPSVKDLRLLQLGDYL